MKLVYLGTPAMAVPPLEALVAAGHEIALVVTGPDRRRGRGGRTSPSPVKAAALDHGLPVSHRVDDIVDLLDDGVAIDLGVVVAFGQLLKPHVLDRLDFVNLHFSLLPRWRGAAPVERAILAGDSETGVCVMEVEAGLDTGGVYARRVVPIADDVTADELGEQLTSVGAALLVDTLAAGLGEPTPQEGEPTYAAKFIADDFRIDWSQPPDAIHRLIRVGGAFTTFRGERLKIHAADLHDDQLRLRIVQPAGKPRMNYLDWRNGAQPGPDETFE